MANATIVKSVKDTLARLKYYRICGQRSRLPPLPSLLVLASQFGLVERAKLFMQKGGHVRGIADFSSPYIKEIRDRLDTGADVRLFPQYQGIFMLVGTDGRASVR